jgi:hypothetical protein
MARDVIVMDMHLHRAREFTGWAFGAVAVAIAALVFLPMDAQQDLAPVTGTVTLAGRPLADVAICFDSAGDHSALDAVGSDGSFCLHSFSPRRAGAHPGKYRVHLFSLSGDTKSIPSKYTDPRTSDIEIEVNSGWNDFRVELN